MAEWRVKKKNRGNISLADTTLTLKSSHTHTHLPNKRKLISQAVSRTNSKPLQLLHGVGATSKKDWNHLRHKEQSTIDRNTAHIQQINKWHVFRANTQNDKRGKKNFI